MMSNDAARAQLEEHGVKIDAFYIIDALGDIQRPTGDRDEFNGWGRIRTTVDLDFGKFSSAHGLTYHATGLWQYGQNMGAIIGSIANPSGLVSIHTFRLDSMWLQQSLANGKVFVKVGQFAAQDFYGIQEYGGNFLMEPLDYAFGNLGNVGASWDPASGPAADIKIVPNSHFYLKTGLYSGRNYSSTGFNYRKQAPSTWDSEVGVQTFTSQASNGKRYSGIVKVGAVYNGGKFYDYQTGKTVNDNYTVYVQVAQPVYRVEAGSSRGLDVTAGVNAGPSAKSEVPTEFTMGVTFNAPVASRPRDAVSFGMVYSKIGGSFNNAAVVKLSDEKAFEVNYKAQLTRWLLLQPVLQHYVDVGGSNNSATTAGFRLLTSF
jgi:porin